jgi:hypothetical protein
MQRRLIFKYPGHVNFYAHKRKSICYTYNHVHDLSTQAVTAVAVASDQKCRTNARYCTAWTAEDSTREGPVPGSGLLALDVLHDIVALTTCSSSSRSTTRSGRPGRGRIDPALALCPKAAKGCGAQLHGRCPLPVLPSLHSSHSAQPAHKPHLSKHHVLAVQPARGVCLHTAQEELAAVGVGAC